MKRGILAFKEPKSGVAIDLDWIISLGFFLIYLGVFFIAIRQLPSQQTPAESLLGNVRDEILDSTSWSVQRLPLFITSNISGTEPIIVKFTYGWGNFSFSDNTSFDLIDSRLIFVKHLNQGKNALKLVRSGENYTLPNAVFELTASASSASVNSKRFMAEFSNSLLARATHFDKARLDELNISLSGIVLKPEIAAAEANTTAMTARYKLIFPQLNHTAYIVAGYSRIFNYVSTEAKEEQDFLLSTTLRNYSFFHISNAAAGTINYTMQECNTAFGSYADFYDDISGVTFILPESSNITFCAGNSAVRLELRFPLRNESRYDIIFHDGDFNTTLKYATPLRTAFGIAENLTGISSKLYKKMNETSYDALRNSWSYPSSRDFSFSLETDSGAAIFNYQPKTPGITNVFAKESDVFIIDKYAKKTKYTLRIRGW